MATAPELHEREIAAARSAAWHQTGDPLLTLDAARTWLNEFGLVLFAPRAGSLGVSAPSLVEATLGGVKTTVTLAETEVARTLSARLVGEGSAVPLNLLGGPGDIPDFLVSTQVFPLVFTLRGDKSWKRAPETSGAIKVTPLGLRVYELLSEKGAMTVEEIVPEIGREITESAVARALGELWQILRVIPVLQQGEGATRWELLTARFLRMVKTGANAGQPTALSGLVSSFLAQVYVAQETEIEAFLSPLTARSRVRDVLHGLVAARELAEGVIAGKTVLYIPDSLPDFAAMAAAGEEDESAASEASGPDETGADAVDLEESEGSPDRSEDAGSEDNLERSGEAPQRIRKFEGGAGDRSRPVRGKPVRRDSGSGGRPSRPGFDRRPGRAEESPARFRRSFGAEAGAGSAATGEPQAGDAGEARPTRRPFRGDRDERPARKTFGGGDRPERRPFQRNGEGRPERRPFQRSGDGRPERRPPSREGSDRPERRPFQRSGEGRPERGNFERRGEEGRPPRRPFPAGGEDRPRRSFGGSENRPPRREGRPEFNRPWQEDRPRRRPEQGEGETGGSPPRFRSGDGEARPRRFEGGREGGDRPAFNRGRGPQGRPSSDAGGRESRPFRPFAKGPGAARPFRPRGESAPDAGREAGPRPFRPREGGREDAGFSGPRRGAAKDRPAFGEKRPGGFRKQADGEARPFRGGQGAGGSRFGGKGPGARRFEGGGGGARGAGAGRFGPKGPGKGPARGPRPDRPPQRRPSSEDEG